MITLLKAAQDLRYLLSKGYPRPGALTFVGNHYQLPKESREILSRGVYPDKEAQARRRRLASPEKIKGRALGLDGHNVLITLESAILGRPLVACDDGLIRDTAKVSSSFRPGPATEQALNLILDYITRQGVKSVLFLLDAPLSMSGELAGQASAGLAARDLMGRARAVPVPEVELYSFRGLVATSDSVLIDRVAEPLDLAGHIIRETMPGIKPLSLNLNLDDGPAESERAERL